MPADLRRHVRHRTNSRGEAAESAANAERQTPKAFASRQFNTNVEISMHHKRLMMSVSQSFPS